MLKGEAFEVVIALDVETDAQADGLLCSAVMTELLAQDS